MRLYNARNEEVGAEDCCTHCDHCITFRASEQPDKAPVHEVVGCEEGSSQLGAIPIMAGRLDCLKAPVILCIFARARHAVTPQAKAERIWVTVVQLPDGDSLHAPVQPRGPPVVPIPPLLAPPSTPRGLSEDFLQIVSSGSVRFSGDASHQRSPGSPG